MKSGPRLNRDPYRPDRTKVAHYRPSMLTDESRLAGVKFRSQPCRCFSSVWRLPLENTVGLLTVGTWLSLVEHSLGVRGVGSSNLPVPTKSFSSLPSALAPQAVSHQGVKL